MDDIAEDGEVRGFVEGAEFGKPPKNVFPAAKRNELATVSMCPGVTEMEIRNAEDAIGFQERGAAVIMIPVSKRFS